MTILTHRIPDNFVASITPGAGISGSIVHKDSIHNRKMIKMNGGGKGC